MKRKNAKVELSVERRKELLLKPNWNYQDVMAYCQVQKSKAFQIMDIVKKQFNGNVLFNPHVVSRDGVLAYMDTSIERERYVIRQLETDVNGVGTH